MLTKIRIKNFKCLQDTGELDIRPLTLLVGPNSSGKSSLLQMLLMLRQTVASTDMDNALAANDGWVQMGAYPEFVYKGDYRRDLSVDLEFTEPTLPAVGDKERRLTPKTLQIRSTFTYNRKTTQIRLRQSEVRLADEFSKQIGRQENGIKYFAVCEYRKNGERKEWRREDVRPVKFYDFRVVLKRGEKPRDLARALPPPDFFDLSLIVETEFLNLFYLGPLREFPRRVYVTSGQAPHDVGTRGERAVDVLWFAHRSKGKSIRKIEQEVRTWFKAFDFANDIRLDPVGRGNYYRVVIIDPATQTETNLADIGFGASQTLPIIIESFYAPLGSVILIEQPEIHLHPKAQTVLGDLFIRAASEANRAFIVETHSEHILARLRRRIAEKQLSTDKVAIYYFQPTPEGTHIQPVTLNEQGQYESFPEGFFEEDVVEAFEHLKAMGRASAE